MTRKSADEPPKSIRVPSVDEWNPFGDAAKTMHPTGRSPRTQVLRQFIRWYMRRPGAKLPERPPAGPWSVPLVPSTFGQLEEGDVIDEGGTRFTVMHVDRQPNDYGSMHFTLAPVSDPQSQVVRPEPPDASVMVAARQVR